MPKKIAIVGASGKLGGAALAALQAHNLHPTNDIIALTSSGPPSSPKWAALTAANPGVEVRHASFDDPTTFESALRGVDVFFLVSTPQISLDFGLGMDYDGTSTSGEGEQPRGREIHHKGAIDAAVRAGVSHIVYSSLAFGFSPASTSPATQSITSLGTQSRAGVMRAHLRTEAYLDALVKRHDNSISVTILREGLYSESWPLYLGYFDTSIFSEANATKEENVTIPLANDGKITWTSIQDLGTASAVVIASCASSSSSSSPEEFKNRAFYLSTSPKHAKTVTEIGRIVQDVAAEQQPHASTLDIQVKLVGSEDHVRHYVETRKMPQPAVEWWVSTYDALAAGECLIDDGDIGNTSGGMLEKLLARVGKKPVPVEETIRSMVTRFRE
ncbi:NAD(P)-binding protein [Xylariaceae sp. FL0255]|nr:NAD(P)-binding protein [Xylariaceae sp. FL0255]